MGHITYELQKSQSGNPTTSLFTELKAVLDVQILYTEVNDFFVLLHTMTAWIHNKGFTSMIG